MKDFLGHWLSCKHPSQIPSTLMNWSNPAQPMLLHGLQSKLSCQWVQLANCTSPTTSHLRQSLQATTEEKKLHAILSECKEKLREWKRGRDFCPSGRVSWTSHIAGTKSFCVMKGKKLREVCCCGVFFCLGFYLFFLYNSSLQQSLRVNLKVNLTLHSQQPVSKEK